MMTQSQNCEGLFPLCSFARLRAYINKGRRQAAVAKRLESHHLTATGCASVCAKTPSFLFAHPSQIFRAAEGSAIGTSLIVVAKFLSALCARMEKICRRRVGFSISDRSQLIRV